MYDVFQLFPYVHLSILEIPVERLLVAQECGVEIVSRDA
jgi:hypothetical protein